MQTFADPEEFLSYAKATGRQYASLTLRQGVTLLGSIVIELFDDLCPDTCANFISLIEGPGSYKYKVRPCMMLSSVRCIGNHHQHLLKMHASKCMLQVSQSYCTSKHCPCTNSGCSVATVWVWTHNSCFCSIHRTVATTRVSQCYPALAISHFICSSLQCLLALCVLHIISICAGCQILLSQHNAALFLYEFFFLDLSWQLGLIRV